MITKRYKEKVTTGKSHWSKRGSPINSYLKSIKAHFGKFKGLRLLDAGCAEGKFTYEFSKKGIKAEGIDYEKKFIALAKASYPKIKFRPGNIGKLPYKSNSFDIVFCINTLFYTKASKSLPEIERVLKKGGLGIITLDENIIDLDKGKQIHKLDIEKTLTLLKKSKIKSRKPRQRLDKEPFKHKHYFYEIVFEKI
ncbi:class I SAM-dependent methyltransferase [Candidatus Woesearchaeota archaeon]|nr:class I SAM-dependent methyltransferase [Candidatus Woesearchaeota archaeon]